jgi:hypothetical protein
MFKYYVEFEFQTTAKAVYWFPVQVTAESDAAAQSISDSVLRSLRGKFPAALCSGLTQAHGPLRSVLLNRYKALSGRGVTGSLDLNIWTMNVDFDDFSIPEEIDLMVSGVDSPDSTIYATVRQVQIPIHQLSMPVENTSEGRAFIVKVVLSPSSNVQLEQDDDA